MHFCFLPAQQSFEQMTAEYTVDTIAYVKKSRIQMNYKLACGFTLADFSSQVLYLRRILKKKYHFPHCLIHKQSTKKEFRTD